MNVIIRKALNSYYKEIMALYGKFVEDSKRFAKSNNDSYKQILKSKNSFVYVAFINKKIVGFISFSLRAVVRHPRPILEIEEFFVVPEHRRKGIGKALMNVAISFAKKKKCSRIFLASSKERTDAHKFYKSMKFEEYGYHFLMKT